jgi:hypothetical protein
MDTQVENPSADRGIIDRGVSATRDRDVRGFEWIRTLTFKVIVVLNALLVIGGFNLVLLMLVVSWLPDATYASIIGETDPSFLTHRVHDSVNPLIAWTLLIGTVVQLRRPEKRLAPVLMMLAIPLSFFTVELLTGTFELADNLPFIGVLLITALHPGLKEMIRIRRLDKVMLGFAVLAAAGYLPFAVRQARLQTFAPAGDPHAAMEHWTRMAVFAIFLVLWSIIGSTDRPGWRLTAWIAGAASIWYGLQSVLFPVASAATLPWAAAAIGGGAAYIAVAERRARIGQPEVEVPDRKETA